MFVFSFEIMIDPSASLLKSILFYYVLFLLQEYHHRLAGDSAFRGGCQRRSDGPVPRGGALVAV